MSVLAQALTLIISIGAIAVVVALVRAGRLKERYAFVWLMVAAGMLVLALARPLLDRLSQSLGIQSGTTTLFLIATLVILGVLLQLSVTVTALEEKLRDLAEAVALSEPSDPAQHKNSKSLPESE